MSTRQNREDVEHFYYGNHRTGQVAESGNPVPQAKRKGWERTKHNVINTLTLCVMLLLGGIVIGVLLFVLQLIWSEI